MPKIEKKPKPFVRATGSHYDKEKWKTAVDKTKFERKLDDWPAFRTAMSNMASQFAKARANAYYN